MIQARAVALKSTCSRRIPLLFFLFVAVCPLGRAAFAQTGSDSDETIRGVVVNSVTGEPISRALVHSPDERFAMLTNSEGRFEFTVRKSNSGEGPSDTKNDAGGGGESSVLNGPHVLLATKPGYLPDAGNYHMSFRNNGNKEWTLRLTPEALIVGTVSLPTAEAPDSIMLQVFRREVQDGRAHYVPAGITQSRSDGQFRFVGLTAGAYKLLTQEMLDQDPAAQEPGGPVFGYPPVFYPNASDFGSAATIELSAGQTQTANLTLVKQRYYSVKVPVSGAGNAGLDHGVGVDVYGQGRKGPGFSLGYNVTDQAVEGLLPNGIYTIDVTSYGPRNESGTQTITIKGGPVRGPGILLVPSGSIPVHVTEEFTSSHRALNDVATNGNSGVEVKGPRQYLNVTLVPADDGDSGRRAGLQESRENPAEPLLIDSPAPGNYWVQVSSSVGYAATVRSGNLDLLRQPLVVGPGGTAPIEITMRDDMAEISGTVEGVAAQGSGQSWGNSDLTGNALYAGARKSDLSRARVYCVPLPDGSGQYAERAVGPDGSFHFAGLPPGAYQLFALDGGRDEIEYRNAEAMRVYESKGTVVRVSGGQKERVAVPMTTKGEN
jgi:hypothetical protein